MPVFCALLLAAAAHGQALLVSPAQARPGELAEITIVLKAPPGKFPVAIQWQLELPAELIGQSAPPVLADAAKRNDKEAHCAGMWKKAPRVYSYLCVVAGGQKAIGEGPVSLLRISLPPNTRTGNYRIRVENSVGVMQDLKKIHLKAAEGTLTVIK